MKRAGVGGFVAACRAAGASRGAERTDPDARVAARRNFLLELECQGVGGRFRHIAIDPPGWWPGLGAVAAVALLGFALVAGGAFSVWPSEAMGRPGVDAIVRENAALRAQQDALRARAFDLAEQLYGRVEQGRWLVSMANAPGHAQGGEYPRPPARGSGDEAILAWLSEQGTLLEALGSELTVDRAEVGLKLASLPAPWTSIGRRTASTRSTVTTNPHRNRKIAANVDWSDWLMWLRPSVSIGRRSTAASAILSPSRNMKKRRKITSTTVSIASNTPISNLPLRAPAAAETRVTIPVASLWKPSGEMRAQVLASSRKRAILGSATDSDRTSRESKQEGRPCAPWSFQRQKSDNSYAPNLRVARKPNRASACAESAGIAWGGAPTSIA